MEKDGLATIDYHVRATIGVVYITSIHADAAARVWVRCRGVAPKTTR